MSARSIRHLLYATSIYGSESQGATAQAFHHVASCGRAFTSHQTPGFEQSKCAHTHTSQVPCPQLEPQSSGKHLSPFATIDAKDGESSRENLWEGDDAKQHLRSLPLNTLFTEHVPYTRQGLGSREKYEQDTGEIRRP